MQEKEEDKYTKERDKEVLENFDNLEKRQKIRKILITGIIVVFVMIVLFLIFSFYQYFQSPERTLGLGANIKSALINSDGKLVYVKLLGGSLDKNITKIKFLFYDSDGNEHIYETTEGIQEIEVPFKRSFWDWLFGRQFIGSYDYEINSENAGLSDFSDINEVDVSFEYQTETGEVIETPVLDTGRTTNKTTTPGGGSGPSSGGGNPPQTCTPEPKETTCGAWVCGIKKNNCNEDVDCGNCNINENCIDGNCISNFCLGINDCSNYTDETNCTLDSCEAGVCKWNSTSKICYNYVGKTYYVDAALGNDSWVGTSSQPWKTLNRTYTWYSGNGIKVQEGDTVLFRNGSYGSFDETAINEATVRRRSNWITYVAAPGHTPEINSIYIEQQDKWLPIEHGSSYLIFDGFDIPNRISLRDTSYVKIIDCNVQSLNTIEPLEGNYIPYIPAGSSIYVTGAEHIIIQGCKLHTNQYGYYTGDSSNHILIKGNEIYDSTGDLIGLKGHDIIVEDNDIHDCRKSSMYLTCKGIINYNSSAGFQKYETVIQDVTGAVGAWKGAETEGEGLREFYIYHISGPEFDETHNIVGKVSGAYVRNVTKVEYHHADGIQVDNSDADGLIIQRNKIHPVFGQGIKVTSKTPPNQIDKVSLLNNLIYDTNDHSMLLTGINNLKIYNNTCYNNLRPVSHIRIYTDDGQSSTNVTLFNNICQLDLESDKSGQIVQITGHGNNIFRNNPSGMGGPTYPFYINSSSELVDYNITNLFVDPSNNNFRVKMNSPACDGSLNGMPGVAVGALPCVCTSDSQCISVFGSEYSCNSEGKCVKGEGEIFEASYYVDNSIEDCATYNVLTRTCGTGSEKAYNTLQEAVNVSVAGDLVLVREGIYKERIILKNNGTFSSHITFKAYPGEEVILDGGVDLTGWTQCESQAACDNNSNWDKIYYTNYNYSDIACNLGFISGCMPFMIYENDEMMIRAQYPNQNDPYDPWNISLYLNQEDGDAGWLIDNDLTDEFNYIGAKINIYAYVMVNEEWKNDVIAYDSVTHRITSDNPTNFSLSVPSSTRVMGYSFWNKLQFLDMPGEFYVDNSSKRVYIRAYDDEIPDNIKASKLTNAFDFSINGANYITIDGLIIKNYNSNHWGYSDGVFYMGRAGKRVHDIVIRNNIVYNNIPSAVDMDRAANITIENNHFYHNGMVGESSQGFGIHIGNCSSLKIINNTIHSNKDDGIYIQTARDVVIDRNRIYDQDSYKTHHDGIKIETSPTTGTEPLCIGINVTNNFVYDSMQTIFVSKIKDSNFINNTIWGSWDNGIRFLGNTSNLNILYNTIISKERHEALKLTTAASNVVVEKNVLDGWANTVEDFAIYQSVSHDYNLYVGRTWCQADAYGWPFSANEIILSKINVTLNNTFVNYNNNDYHLLISSPACNGSINPVGVAVGALPCVCTNDQQCADLGLGACDEASGKCSGLLSLSPFTKIWNWIKNILTGKTEDVMNKDGETNKNREFKIQYLFLSLLVVIILIIAVVIVKNKSSKKKTRKKSKKKR